MKWVDVAMNRAAMGIENAGAVLLGGSRELPGLDAFVGRTRH
jgi:hypothetical protein